MRCKSLILQSRVQPAKAPDGLTKHCWLACQQPMGRLLRHAARPTHTTVTSTKACEHSKHTAQARGSTHSQLAATDQHTSRLGKANTKQQSKTVTSMPQPERNIISVSTECVNLHPARPSGSCSDHTPFASIFLCETCPNLQDNCSDAVATKHVSIQKAIRHASLPAGYANPTTADRHDKRVHPDD